MDVTLIPCDERSAFWSASLIIAGRDEIFRSVPTYSNVYALRIIFIKKVELRLFLLLPLYSK